MNQLWGIQQPCRCISNYARPLDRVTESNGQMSGKIREYFLKPSHSTVTCRSGFSSSLQDLGKLGDVQNIQDIQDVQDNQDFQDIHDIQDIQNIQDIKDIQDFKPYICPKQCKISINEMPLDHVLSAVTAQVENVNIQAFQ